MFAQTLRPAMLPVAPADIRSVDVADLLFRAFSDLHHGFLPGARLEALIDHLEMRK